MAPRAQSFVLLLHHCNWATTLVGLERSTFTCGLCEEGQFLLSRYSLPAQASAPPDSDSNREPGDRGPLSQAAIPHVASGKLTALEDESGNSVHLTGLCSVKEVDAPTASVQSSTLSAQ